MKSPTAFPNNSFYELVKKHKTSWCIPPSSAQLFTTVFIRGKYLDYTNFPILLNLQFFIFLTILSSNGFQISALSTGLVEVWTRPPLLRRKCRSSSKGTKSSTRQTRVSTSLTPWKCRVGWCKKDAFFLTNINKT